MVHVGGPLYNQWGFYCCRPVPFPTTGELLDSLQSRCGHSSRMCLSLQQFQHSASRAVGILGPSSQVGGTRGGGLFSLCSGRLTLLSRRHFICSAICCTIFISCCNASVGRGLGCGLVTTAMVISSSGSSTTRTGTRVLLLVAWIWLKSLPVRTADSKGGGFQQPTGVSVGSISQVAAEIVNDHSALVVIGQLLIG